MNTFVRKYNLQIGISKISHIKEKHINKSNLIHLNYEAFK